ncbi:hypothetical protein [Ilumatobacter nonamiensis]|uniref:hypothetical protein n=1 Tax=Ilumatobacter nonamiensis TaxID=467093 RepID=UPI00034A826D|nr:hypothetical protein [Ilumatobacter nonamiensis]
MKQPRRPNDDRSLDRRRRITFVAMVAAVGASVVAGPTLVDALSDRLNQPEVETLGPPADSTPEAPTTALDEDTSTEPARTVPTTTNDEADDTTTTTTTPTPTTTTTPRVPLRTVQLVPPLRDVIVGIDGRSFASDAAGVIDLSTAEPNSEFEFIGVQAQPSLREVAVGVWSDGSTLANRDVADIDGPTAEIGLVVSNRVTVSAQQAVPEGAQLVFESTAGPLRLSADRTAWVPASRAVPSRDGLTEQALVYTLVAMTVDGVTFDLPAQEFEPAPEALWVVSTAGAERR